uniref:Uncharacterized protein n=1 Tax=Oryza brachyantha TaxID=4533 RepID=J3LSN7_ORYBR
MRIQPLSQPLTIYLLLRSLFLVRNPRIINLLEWSPWRPPPPRWASRNRMRRRVRCWEGSSSAWRSPRPSSPSSPSPPCRRCRGATRVAAWTIRGLSPCTSIRRRRRPSPELCRCSTSSKNRARARRARSCSGTG